MNRALMVFIVVLMQGCGDNGAAQEKTINLHIAKNVSTIKTHDELQKSFKMLYVACPGLNLYKKDITSWEFVNEDAPYPFMTKDYGWSNAYTEFETIILRTKESTIPVIFNAFGHTCQYRVSGNGEVDIIKTPCASVCLGSLAPKQSHNYLIINGKNVIRW